MMSDEQLIYANVLEKRMERMRQYVVAGRRFASLPEDLLIAQWVTAWRALASTPSDNGWDALLTIECEFELRQTRLPMHLVGAERIRFSEHVGRIRLGSKRHRAAWEKASAELAALRMRLAQPKH